MGCVAVVEVIHHKTVHSTDLGGSSKYSNKTFEY
jgi:hypothetical protein